MKTRFSARVDSKLLEESKKYYGGSVNSMLELALEEFVQKRKPDVELLKSRKVELEQELITVNKELENAKELIEKHETTKKAIKKPEIDENPLDSVRQTILRQLENSSIETILKSVYMKAFKKKLGCDESEIIELILSLANEERLREYDTTVTPLCRRVEVGSSSSSSSSSSRVSK